MTNKEFILGILNKNFGKLSDNVLQESELLQYLLKKTKSVNSSSKSRGSFANLYAIYVLVEDYIHNGYLENCGYSTYEGMKFTDAFTRQRQLPFGQKLQNHALNHRCNEEFRKYFPDSKIHPIKRDTSGNYWIEEGLLKVNVRDRIYNIAESVIEIVNAYIKLKLEHFEGFFNTCIQHKESYEKSPARAIKFIYSQLSPNVDARIFEIVSFVILKFYYKCRFIYMGEDINSIEKLSLDLYKTGRTNANDGGIDFIMKPLGRVFQVTEVMDFKKYFLDINKIDRYSISFVVKTEKSSSEVLKIIESNAKKELDRALADKYLRCFEEIITIPRLQECLNKVVKDGLLGNLLDELVLQCQVEYNLVTDNEEEEEEEEA